jgi:nanoRNase/pAp phosphatase (c-di-AMP/oligoRNAs hydrolase)
VQIHKIRALIDKRSARRVLLLCHHNADPDAICSAFAFSRLLKRLFPRIDIKIAAAQGPSKLSKFLLKFFPMTLTEQPNIEEADIIVLLDTNTVQQLDEWGERVKASKAAIIVIDHHASHSETERLATIIMADEAASSTCEIIYRLFKEAKAELKPMEAKALFLGIAFDTKHFILASSATLKILADLIDVGVKVEEALPLLSLPMDPSERVARLKACKRVKLFKINDWIVVFSHVSAFQASAARALVGLGAHLAVVAGQQDEKIQISMRATREFHEKTGVHLGRDVAKPLGEYLHGMGGGHAVSAGVNGVGDLEASFKRCLRLLKEKLAKT